MIILQQIFYYLKLNLSKQGREALEELRRKWKSELSMNQTPTDEDHVL